MDAAVQATTARDRKKLSRLSPEKRRVAFLAELARGQSVAAAAAAIGLTRQAMYKARGTDAVFAAAWDDAVEIGTDVLEDVAVKRAKDGSDTLLIFMLKARRPEKFKERSHQELSGSGGSPLVPVIHVSLSEPRPRASSQAGRGPSDDGE
jgi:hypothetical protein